MSVQTIKKSIYAAGAPATLLLTNAVFAQSVNPDVQEGAEAVQGNLTGDLTATLSLVVNTLIFVIGLVAVIMLIVGGFRYVFSQGNEKAVQGAKDTILYAIIGIVVAVLAFAIVNFVIQSVGQGPSA